MPNRLLDRQVSLLEYLSSPATIFGDEAEARVDPTLQGMDRGLLKLQARFCRNKRIEKVFAVFPRTLELFGADRWLILRKFVEATRPTTLGRLATGRQFYEFLCARWSAEAPDPAYLQDVAACELATVEVCNVAQDDEQLPERDESDGPKSGIRRSRNVVPLRCAHDIRRLFETGSGDVVPPQRDTSLAVMLPANAREVTILQISPAILHVLVQLDKWTDPKTLDATGHAENLVSYLVAHELVEVRA